MNNKPTRRKSAKKREKQQALTIICSVITVFAIVVLIFSLTHKAPTGNKPEYSKADDTTASSVTATSTTASTATSATTQSTQTGSFYDNVKYRSPTAKTADIEKHGRNLMLLNNDYELPEDFKWDLVYWTNGNSVDALSLNSEKYDSVKAVDRAAYEPLKDMFADAEKAGVPLELVSAYRSISLQDRLFTRSVNSYMNNGYSEEEAVKKANFSRTFTGTSEHNTGLGFDILQKGSYYLTDQFENTPQFKWLMENAENYGFILRYNKDKVSVTGIMYEPWHFRYVGIENAKKINDSGLCLEEYIDYLEE